MTDNSQDWGSRPTSANSQAPDQTPPSTPPGVTTGAPGANPQGMPKPVPPASPDYAAAAQMPANPQPILSTQQSQPVQAVLRPIQPARAQPPRQAPPPVQRRSGCAGVALFVLIIVALGVLAFGIVLVGYAGIARDLPMPDELQARPATSPQR